MIHESVASCIGKTPLVHLRRLFPSERGPSVIAKLEFLNPGGSVKDRPARFIVEQGLKDGTIRKGTHLVESTSGNLGIALAMVARVHGLTFTSVVDPKISQTNLRILKSYGARIDMVSEPDDQGGYLKTRIRRVQELLETMPGSVWINQYANQLNWQAHFHGAGSEIVQELDAPIDYLVASVSTTGTILGLARRLRKEFPRLRVIAVDAVGSVIFGTQPAPRDLPGIGSSRVPELLCREEIDEVILVNDWESVEGCRELLTHEGIFAGGSSGSVVAAIRKLAPTLPAGSRVLTLFPDRGERYLDLFSDEAWLSKIRLRAEQQVPMSVPLPLSIPPRTARSA
ncbi:2,3-diaminopropionate biosynthesis protein SbnA [Archangium lipolyticum]|uniref:2,3-diaminopropionate biosynthesis protein SbnA n=1 Tax=Archangium lipolyticum TaxID=2970465 RepID=UPI002149ACFC|nr:2,3-diaminopropionate biosynthesis protein SbnA [Archangium lipolyticum]